MSDATVPWEAFDVTHPDHGWWFEQTGKCLAPICAEHQSGCDVHVHQWVRFWGIDLVVCDTCGAER